MMRQEDGVFVGILQAFILNEAQWLNFASLTAWKIDMSSPLDFLLCVVADESRAGVMQLQHSYLQIQGWQGSSASFNYEWQLFISCLLIRWVDFIALTTFSSLILFSIIPHSSRLQWNIRGERKGPDRIILEFKRVRFQAIQWRIHMKGKNATYIGETRFKCRCYRSWQLHKNTQGKVDGSILIIWLYSECINMKQCLRILHPYHTFFLDTEQRGQPCHRGWLKLLPKSNI